MSCFDKLSMTAALSPLSSEFIEEIEG